MWTNIEYMSSDFYLDAHDLSFPHKIYVTASTCWNYRKPNKNLYWSGPSEKFLFSFHLWNLITKRLFPRVRSTNQMFEVLEIPKTEHCRSTHEQACLEFFELANHVPKALSWKRKTCFVNCVNLKVFRVFVSSTELACYKLFFTF